MRTTMAVFAGLMAMTLATEAGTAPVAVCTTTTDLGALVRSIGGDDVSLTVFAKGMEDPHFVEPRPSFLRALHEAELVVVNGLDLEVGWLRKLLQSARNPAILPGGAGHLDASRGVAPLDVPTGPLDRSIGDVHPAGNPHYLLDPVSGLRVAAIVRDALTRLRPERRAAFDERHDAFAARLGAALVGEALADDYDAAKLAELHALGGLAAFLDAQGRTGSLGGWLAATAPHRGALVVADHGLWPYFARRFGVEVVMHLEAKPGYPPTSRHLSRVIRTMQERRIGVVLASPYFDPRHAELVARATGARVLAMAHQVGARPEATDYVHMIDWNVRQLVQALEQTR